MTSSDEVNELSHLAALFAAITQLTEQPWFGDSGRLLKQMESLQAKVIDQEATIAQLNEKHKDRQEAAAETYAHITQKKGIEIENLKRLLADETEKLQKADESVKSSQEKIEDLQKKIDAQDEEVRKIEAHLQDVRSQIECSQKTVEDNEAQLKSKDEQLQSEKEAYQKLKSEADLLTKECAELEAFLKVSDGKLEQINQLAPPLMEDSGPEVAKEIRKIYQLCCGLCLACFKENNPIEQLRDTTRFRALQTSDPITYAVPLAPINSPTARKMRALAMLAILSRSLVRHLLCSTYLFDDSAQAGMIMLETADANPDKEALLRRLLNSMSADTEEELIEERKKKVTAEVTGCIEPLLSVEQSQKMRSDLAEALDCIADLWKSLQKRRSLFAVEPQDPGETSSTWKSLVWLDDKKRYREENVTAPKDVVLVLFPRIFMLNREGEHEVFPGVLLLKPGTTAAQTELAELPPMSPLLARVGTNRPPGGRRGSSTLQNGLPRSVAQ